MNKIVDLFTNITDEELKQAIKEIKEDDETLFIREGVVRKYAKLCSEITEQSPSKMLFLAQLNLLKEAAYRWIINTK